jgi:hypothetical protein
MITYLLEVFALPTQSWESAAVAEVIHKVVTQPDLLKWICENYDQNPTSSCLLNSIFASINSFLHRCLDDSLEDSENHDENELDEQQGFVYRNTFLPLHEISPRRSILLDWLEKHNAERIPEAYGLTIAYFIYVDATRSINNVMEDILDTANTDQNSPLHTTFFRSTYSHLLNGLALLLNCRLIL